MIHRPIVWLVLILTVYLSLTCIRAGHKSFWHDEILTLAIANLRSVHEMWDAELMGFDFNPPLNAVLTKASMAIAGKPELTARVPPIAGYLLMLVFVGRRLPAFFSCLQ